MGGFGMSFIQSGPAPSGPCHSQDPPHAATPQATSVSRACVLRARSLQLCGRRMGPLAPVQHCPGAQAEACTRHSFSRNDEVLFAYHLHYQVSWEWGPRLLRFFITASQRRVNPATQDLHTSEHWLPQPLPYLVPLYPRSSSQGSIAPLPRNHNDGRIARGLKKQEFTISKIFTHFLFL